MENQEIKIETVSENSLGIILKAEIDTQIATAKSFPRSLKQFTDRAISMATLNEGIAASCNYALPRGGKTLEGKSVRLAEIIASCYGNIRSGARIISNNGKVIVAQGICHDLETNNSVTVEITRKITDKYGKTFSEDMQVVTGNAACAIAFRNAVFKVIPSALSDEVYEKAKAVAKGTEATLPERRKKAVDYFKGIGVSEARICSTLEVKRIEDIDLEKLFVLNGIYNAVKNNETTIAEAFVEEKKNPLEEKK